MKKDTTEDLLNEIENLRNQLHRKVGNHSIEDHEILMDHDLLQMSKRLDELILTYMSLSNKK
ncbi:aspartyl-phosphate phosphatase Spo0E family protein [Tepidibacillus infernus]|uniref:Uncharacterized protein n=1 Tax=Tepidibacillus decaturensis TaxID=1413211 RepID=A0A135L366_9BACI|nr:MULTISPECIES: aspartyl-phosphate phosphatase Spo0E family protein [Tepidibacillus]KXG43436.1 hypothetical protein U473_04965 [Tepidibacillus decaturensis]GBF11292.1 hypothetical protein HK1_01316 [Tepidibacillus sp. HK-1]